MRTMTYDCMAAEPARMDPALVRELNSRLFFQSGMKRPQNELRPWQYVEMEYRGMGLMPPAYVPPLDSMEDAEIWMCLDERVNQQMRLRETAIAV